MARGSSKRGKPVSRGRLLTRGRASAAGGGGEDEGASESSKADTTTTNDLDSTMDVASAPLIDNIPSLTATTSSVQGESAAGPSDSAPIDPPLPHPSATLPAAIETNLIDKSTPPIASPLMLKFRTNPGTPGKPESSSSRKKDTTPARKPPRPQLPRPVQTFTTALSYPKEDDGHSGAGLGMAGWGAEPGGAMISIRRTTAPGGATLDESGRKQRKSKLDAMGRLNEDGLGPQPPLHAPASLATTSAAAKKMGSRAGTPTGSPSTTTGPAPANNPINKMLRMSPAPVLDLASVRTQGPRHPPPRTQERMFGLKECPTFYPTKEEFADPMEYIRMIGEGGGEGEGVGGAVEGARKYGMCKIVPPEGWQMPFQLDTETFRFKTRLQRLNQLEASSRAKINFLQQLQMFHSQQGNPTVTIPIVDRKPLDIWALKKEIALRGGYDFVCLNRLWGDLARKMGYAPNNSHQLKAAYSRIIQPFEDFLAHVKLSSPRQSPGGASIGSPLTPLVTPAHGKTRGRAMNLGEDRRSATPSREGSVRPGEEGTSLRARDGSPGGPSTSRTRRRSGSKSTNASVEGTGLAGDAELNGGGSKGKDKAGLVDADADVDMDAPAALESAIELVEPQTSAAAIGKKRKRMTGPDPPVTPMKRGRGKKTDEATFEKGDACEICFSGAHAKKILLCDDCDRGYHIYCLDPPLAAVPDNEEWFCTECLLGTGNDFGFDEGEEHTISSFQKRATAFRKDWFRNHPPAGPPARPTDSDAMDVDHEHATNGVSETVEGLTVSEHDVEKEFWRLVESANETVEIEYGADIHSTTHGSAAPTLETDPRDPHSIDPWNLNNMPILPKSLLRYIKSDISGMTVPWTYIGMLFATFCWHNEDHYTYSVNYMYWGETKTWYGIAGDQADKLEQAMMSEAPELFEQQPSLLYQLVTMMNPGRLKDAGLDVTVCDQRPNEFVITFPKAYHCGFNHGLNYNEAVNFALPDWLDYGYDCILRYQTHKKSPVFSHEELLVTISQHSQSIQTSLWLRDGLKAVVEREMANRQELRTSIPHLSEVIQNVDHPEDQYICCECKAFCYLAQMTCSCTKLVSCLEHPSALCGCNATNRILRLRFSDRQLMEILARTADRALLPNTWRARLQRVLDDSPRPSLKSLKSLLSEGERVTFPLPELDALRHFVSQANAWLEMASGFLTKRMQPRSTRRKGKDGGRDGRDADGDDMMSIPDEEDKERKTVEDLEVLLKQVEKAGFDSPEIGRLQNLRISITDFRQQAQMILAQPESELKLAACDSVFLAGGTLNVDLPELSALDILVSRLRWLHTMEDLDEPFLQLEDVQRYLQEADDCNVPSTHEFYKNLQAKLKRGEQWDHRADNVLARAAVEIEGKANIKFEELDKLLEQDIETPVNREKQSRIRALRVKALSAQTTCKTLMNQPDIKKRTIAQMRRTIKSAEQKAGFVIVPELMTLKSELKRYDRWLKELMPLLPLGADMSKVISTLAESCRALLMPADYEPKDPVSNPKNSDLDFACVCRQSVVSTKLNMLLVCRKCSERYHPGCLKLNRAQESDGLDKWKCPFCRKKDHLTRDTGRITATKLSEYVASEKWRFAFNTEELEDLREVFVWALKIAKIVLPALNPTSKTNQCRDKLFMRHWLKKMHLFPVTIDPHTPDGYDFILFDVLFSRLRFVSRFNPPGPGEESIPDMIPGFSDNKPTQIVPKRAELHLVRRSKDKEGCRCICYSEPCDSLVQVGCAKCRQKFHAACVYAPKESWGSNGLAWTCPLCCIQSGKVYPHAQVLCQFEAHLGTNIFVDAAATAKVGSEVVTRLQLEPNDKNVMLIVANRFEPAVRLPLTHQPSRDGDRRHHGSGRMHPDFNSGVFDRHRPGMSFPNKGRPHNREAARGIPGPSRYQPPFLNSPLPGSSPSRPGFDRMNSPAVAGLPQIPRLHSGQRISTGRPPLPGVPIPGAPGFSPNRPSIHPRPFSAVTKGMVIPPFRGSKPAAAGGSATPSAPPQPSTGSPANPAAP